MTYLLDADICIYIIKEKYAHVADKIRLYSPGDIKISAITVSELMYGCYKSSFPSKNVTALRGFLSPFEIISYNARDAMVYGGIRAELEAKGQIIGPYDMQLAAQAINRSFTVVTNNVREFKRISTLKIDNWL
jgi:tRNA(fMet)-specific endonuclease VapC